MADVTAIADELLTAVTRINTYLEKILEHLTSKEDKPEESLTTSSNCTSIFYNKKLPEPRKDAVHVYKTPDSEPVEICEQNLPLYYSVEVGYIVSLYNSKLGWVNFDVVEKDDDAKVVYLITKSSIASVPKFEGTSYAYSNIREELFDIYNRFPLKSHIINRAAKCYEYEIDGCIKEIIDGYLTMDYCWLLSVDDLTHFGYCEDYNADTIGKDGNRKIFGNTILRDCIKDSESSDVELLKIGDTKYANTERCDMAFGMIMK